MSRENSRGRRPFKVWDSSRSSRKALVVASLEELIVRGREKLGVGVTESIKAVLESDGTQVDDSEYFRSLPDNTVFLLLRPGERWCPAGVDVIRADLQGSSSGRIPVIGGGSGTGIRTMITKDGKLETVINDFSPKTPSITVISHEDPPYDSVPRSRSNLPPPLPPHAPTNVGHSQTQTHPYQYSSRGLPRQGSSSIESTGATAPIHVHTVECSTRGHFPPQHPPHGSGGRGSPPEPSYCDFHCCALHEEGRKIQVHKAVATSPIQDPGFPHDPRGAKSLHVRFMGVTEERSFGKKNGIRIPAEGMLLPAPPPDLTATESSESETENNNSSILEEDNTSCLKFLLLTDQLSLDQKRHLTIKDIGVILERLSSKIIDVERLDRETEGVDCYNWTIKATIRGDALRELGVIYNGNFYAISEHPGYNQQASSAKPPQPPPQMLRREDELDYDEDMRL